MLLGLRAKKQSGSFEKRFSQCRADGLKRAAPIFGSLNIALEGKRVVTSTGETLKNLAIRTVAFIVLTAASTTVLALPYLT